MMTNAPQDIRAWDLVQNFPFPVPSHCSVHKGKIDHYEVVSLVYEKNSQVLHVDLLWHNEQISEANYDTLVETLKSHPKFEA